MVQQGMHCNPDVAIQYDNANEDQDVAIQQTLQVGHFQLRVLP